MNTHALTLPLRVMIINIMMNIPCLAKINVISVLQIDLILEH